MYRAVFFQSNKSEYYRENELLFTVTRNRLILGIRNICKAYVDNDLIFSFYSSEFTFLYWKLKILTQKLDKKIYVEKEKDRYHLIIETKRLSLKFTNNPFRKAIGKIYLDNECICEIEKIEKDSKTYFNFNFNKDAECEYYALILFSMYSVGITDSV